MATAYEYKTVMNENNVGESYKAPDEILNALGLEGWELVGTNSYSSTLSTRIYEVFYLKRVAKADLGEEVLPV